MTKQLSNNQAQAWRWVQRNSKGEK